MFDDNDIAKLACGDVNKKYKSVVCFIKELHEHTLEGYSKLVITSIEEFEKTLSENNVDHERVHVRNYHMSPKKYHEVTTMSRLCARLALHHGVDQTLDIGSGRGYLGLHMALKYAMPVIGLDSKRGNTDSAVKRSEKLAFHWKTQKNSQIPNPDNAEFRATEIEEEEKVLDLNQDLLAMDISDINTTGDTSLTSMKSDVGFVKSTNKRNKGGSRAQKILQERKNTPHSYVAKTMYVEPGLDLSSLTGSGGNDNKVMITGLHTCGSLAPICLRLFCEDGGQLGGQRRGQLASNEAAAKVLCNVGCCYHWLNEEFTSHEYDTDDAKCFPLSKVLLDRKCELGRNARMLASQAVGRMSQNQQLPDKGIYWRAELQVILLERCNNIKSVWNIGKLSHKHEKFSTYVEAALNKMNISDSTIETEDYEARLSSVRRKRMNTFFQLRASLAPVVETLLLLDRYHYLLSQEDVKEAYLVKLFDDLTSPRCYALIANK